MKKERVDRRDQIHRKDMRQDIGKRERNSVKRDIQLHEDLRVIFECHQGLAKKKKSCMIHLSTS